MLVFCGILCCAGQHFNVEVQDVLDWLAAEDSGDNGNQTEPPSVWVLTSSARYRLLTPAAAYAVTFARTRRRLPAAGRNAMAANAADSALAAAGADSAALKEGANARSAATTRWLCCAEHCYTCVFDLFQQQSSLQWTLTFQHAFISCWLQTQGQAGDQPQSCNSSRARRRKAQPQATS